MGIKRAEQRTIIQLLAGSGYAPVHTSLSRYTRSDLMDTPKLLIVDAEHHGNQIIGRVRAHLSELLDENGAVMPPILAMVASRLAQKQQIYEQGALDYLSCPLIKAEFQYRVDQALNLTLSQLKNINARISKASPLSGRNSKANNKPKTNHKEEQSWPVGTDNLLAIKTANYLSRKLNSKISLQELAAAMATNRNKLSRAFRNYHGTTVFDWLRDQRMLAAAELLESTTDSVQQIAEQSGYPDSNNFSTAFKRTFEICPVEYRKMQQSKKIVHRSKV